MITLTFVGGPPAVAPGAGGGCPPLVSNVPERPALPRWPAGVAGLPAALAARRLARLGPLRGGPGGVDLRAADQRALDPAQHIQWVAGPDDEVGVLAGLQGAETAVDARDPRRVDGQRADRGRRGQALLDGQGRLVGQEV